MNKMVEKAVGELSTLPEDVQDWFAADLLHKVEKWRALKADIDEGIADLERGNAREIDVEDFLRRARARYANS